MERSEIAIIIPAYNEALTIQNIIQDVEKYGDVSKVSTYGDGGGRLADNDKK